MTADAPLPLAPPAGPVRLLAPPPEPAPPSVPSPAARVPRAPARFARRPHAAQPTPELAVPPAPRPRRLDVRRDLIASELLAQPVALRGDGHPWR